MKLPKQVRRWFTRRAIEQVDSWDGSPSNYADTAAYCKACLIDVNPSGSDKVQGLCKLPVKRPGSSAYADKGIMAAAGGRGITAVTKPADVDQATWDAALKKAAKTIVSAYKDMQRDPPQSVMDMAGMARAISVDMIFAQLQDAVYGAMDDWGMSTGSGQDLGYLVTIYIDAGELYALFCNDGLYNRALLTLEGNSTVTIGQLEPVVQEFVPTQRSSVAIKRQADGRYRVFLLASTAIINRVGQIDSTALYDDMIRRAEEYNFWPTIDFYHMGEDDESCEFGHVDWLAREGVCYLASGTLNPDHPLTEPVARALTEHPEEWGASIEYYPVPDSVDYIMVGTLEIPVFTQGLNTRISLVPEPDAASWFTNFEMERRAMNERQKEALKKLLGEEEFTKRMASVTGVNGAVDKQKLIFRAGGDASGAESNAASGADGTQSGSTTTTTSTNTDASADDKSTAQNGTEGTPELGAEIELDDAAVEAIAGSVTESTPFKELDAMLSGLVEKMTGFMDQIAALKTSVADMQALTTRSVTRLDALEKGEIADEKIRQQDKPRRANEPVGKMHLTYRARHSQPVVDADGEGDDDMEPIANKTLERLPVIGAMK